MKTLRNAGVATIIGLLLGFIYVLIFLLITLPKIGNDIALESAVNSFFSPVILILAGLISIVVLSLTFSGFVDLGKKMNNKLLVVVSWAFLILLILNIIYSIISVSTMQNPLDAASIDNTVEVVFFSLLTLMIALLGISLLFFKGKVDFAKSTGILYIFTAGLFVSMIFNFIGILTYIAALILQAIMFFKVSNKIGK